MTPTRSGAASRRILHRYRRMILLGQASLPLEVARRVVGPDCAYHLYFRHGRAHRARAASTSRSSGSGRGRGRARRRR